MALLHLVVKDNKNKVQHDFISYWFLVEGPYYSYKVSVYPMGGLGSRYWRVQGLGTGVQVLWGSGVQVPGVSRV